ncbi:hypothetical protein FHS60_001998 [Alloprevotella rava]|uniref:Uncharacterized protein n=1 Tax=Alloprevotella rava TaxID=671218 RepID=A0A7W5UL65_9BACT|nr:hypothetical protein [Alloprevotella rava]
MLCFQKEIVAKLVVRSKLSKLFLLFYDRNGA